MLLREKADQAQALLSEVDLDCWLTFVRETDIHPDPGVDLVVGADLVRNSAFLFGKGGERVAIVARFDAANIRRAGVFGEVVGYDEDVRGPLLEALGRIDPQSIGLNYSVDDQTADGLTHGHWLMLNELLRGTPYLERLTSAEPLLTRLRGRKSSGEVERIRQAIRTTEEIVDWMTSLMKVGSSEKDVADAVHAEFRARGLVPAWGWEGCPIVNSGPASEPGHAAPDPNIRIEPGHLVHVDIGVVQDGFCSDIQRMWYVLAEGETEPPAEVAKAFGVVREAIESARAVLRPGVVGHVVDTAARRVVVEACYPEYMHGTGHGLGRAVHDGGTMLGPCWPCYGKMPEREVEAGNVFTLELGIATSAGFVGLEEDVVVTEDGAEYLSSAQTELVLV